MALRNERSRAGRARLWLLAGAVLLAFAFGLVRGLREPEPRAAGAPQAREPVGQPPTLPAAPPPTTGREAEAAEPPAPTRREAIRTRLEADLAEHFPDRKPSSDELDAAADALMRLRAARLELKALPRTRENADRIRELTAELGEASADFEYLLDVDPITFTERASGGFDEDEDEEEGE